MLVSVVIPCYNREKELNRSILSVLEQSCQDFEIIVVDDLSEKDIEKVVLEFQDNRIKYYRLNTKGYASGARNKGIELATGKYIAFLDSDDKWFEEHLSVRIKLFEKKNIDGSFGSYVVNGKNRIAEFLKGKDTLLDYVLKYKPSGTPTFFMKSECAKDILFDTSLFVGEDHDFLIRFAKKYILHPCKNVSVQVYWDNKREANFIGYRNFINKYKEEISPNTYHFHHKDMYLSSVKKGAPLGIQRYYFKKAVRYKKYISLVDYLSWIKPKGIVLKLKYRIIFLISNLI